MNKIFETLFGSHIYGTNTPKSDMDYKGVFIAEYKDIILNHVQESVVLTTKKDKSHGVRNVAGDVDREYKELRRFLNDAISGQTYALDMLYTPKSFWMIDSPIWHEIIEERHRFLSKSMNAFLGYIRQQTGKYAMKGTRLAGVVSTIEFLKTIEPNVVLGDVWDKIPTSEFVKLIWHESIVNREPHKELMLAVLEKKFQKNVKTKFVLDNLEKFYQDFGARVQSAMDNQGVDWKAVSHAYRACYQLLDIANHGEIIFPLKQAEYVLKVKSGEINYHDVVQEELPLLMNEAMEAIDNSYLPDQVEREYWDDFIIKIYANPNLPKKKNRKCSNCGSKMKVDSSVDYRDFVYCEECNKALIG